MTTQMLIKFYFINGLDINENFLCSSTYFYLETVQVNQELHLVLEVISFYAHNTRRHSKRNIHKHHSFFTKTVTVQH